MKTRSCFTRSAVPVVAAVLLAVCSCVEEEPVGCPDPRGNVHLTLSIDTSMVLSRAGEDASPVERAHIYVFDADGRYVTSTDVDDPGVGDDFTGEYEFWLTVPAGDYDFVVWTNHGEYYRVNRSIEDLQDGLVTMSDLEVGLDHGGQTLTDHIPHLLHGITCGQAILDATDNHVEVAINPLTYTVNLKALNLAATSHTYAFTITDNNSHYDFEGNLIEGKDYFDHTRTDTAPGGEFNASIRTLMLSADRHPRFTFTDTTTGAVMHDADLIATITRAYTAASRAVDFTTTYTYDIVLSLDTTTMDFSVSVNGWQHDERYEILD